MSRLRTFLAATAFVTLALAPLVHASTEQTFNGDVIINGRFADATPRGHALKFNTPDTTFVAMDWVGELKNGATGSFEALPGGGMRLTKTSGPGTDIGLQQYFNGSVATAREMRFFGGELVASTQTPGAQLTFQIRYDDAGGRQSAQKNIALTAAPATYKVTPSDLGLTSGAQMRLVSVRVLMSAVATVTIDRVGVFATNGVEGRNLQILPAGDDITTSLDAAMLLNPGSDGKYSFTVGMAADSGAFMPTRDAWLCLYDFEQASDDRGFPANYPVICEDAFLRYDHPAVTKTRVGDAFRFDIDASAVRPSVTNVPSIAAYAVVEVDASYDIETPGAQSEFKSGYFNALRMAAGTAGAGVSQEYPFPTPLFIDTDADGRPDFTQTQESDGHSVIITPHAAIETPGGSIIRAEGASYVFDVQVYKYDGAEGAAMDLPGAIRFAIFDGTGLVNGGAIDAAAVWDSIDGGIQRVDARTWRVHVPVDEVPADTPLGAWAFYNVGDPAKSDLLSPFVGPTKSSTDFYSVARNTVKQFAVADALRLAGTPFLLDASGATEGSALVIRVDADADDLTALDGTLVMGDKGDGTITFEYAMLAADGSVRVPGPGGSHALAIYDAAGVVSDELQPGTRGLAHAEWVGKGTLGSDGWFRVNVPLSAFENAKGSVGAWAYVDVPTASGILSRAGWYNILKPAAATLSTSAAQNALYGPTPIIILDANLGIPQALAASIAGAPTDLVSVTNPLVNPGFQADALIEGASDRRDATSGTMTAPPWFLRLDDMGTGQPTRPASTHEIATGKGRLGDNALALNYRPADNGKSLMLGQILGDPSDGNALIWRGATGASFDVKMAGSQPATIGVLVRYLTADGSVGHATGSVTIPPSALWQRVTTSLSVPSDAALLGFHLLPQPTYARTIMLDSIVLEGARTSMGDVRTDVSDGYAVLIQPWALGATEQGLIAGVASDYYLYDIQVADYTRGAPRLLEVGSLAKTFALRTDDLQRGGGIVLALRDRTDMFVAAVPVADIPAPSAVPWAFVNAAPGYSTLGSDLANQPASGHYNPLKNSISAAPLADQLDYAATPVRFGTTLAQTLTAPQQIRLTPVSGGYAVTVEGESPFIETTTLSVSSPGEATRHYPVTLRTSGGDIVSGLVIGTSELERVTLRTADTRFTSGAVLVAGSPIASFEVCKPGAGPCIDTGYLTSEQLLFRSTSVSPTGEALTLDWNFGDGAVATRTTPEVSHAYATPGARTVTLTARTPTGMTSTSQTLIAVDNRAPTILGVDVAPSPIHTDTNVSVRVRSTDTDGGTLSFIWTIDGAPLAGSNTPLLRLTPTILQETTGSPTLQKRSYLVGITVSDGQGGATSAQTSFTVVDRPATVGAPRVSIDGLAGAPWPLAGDSLRVDVTASDADDIIDTVTLDVETPLGATESYSLSASGAGGWTGAVPAPFAGTYTSRASAYANGVLVGSGASKSTVVREDSAPIVTISGANTTELGQAAIYTLTATDPDGRGIVSLTIDGIAGLVCSACGATDNATATAVFDTMGTATLVAHATDATGASASASMDVLVDDIIHLDIEMVRAAQTPNEGHLVRVRVTDVYGAPIAFATVVVQDMVSPLPSPLRTTTVTTGVDGTQTFRVAPEGAGLVNLPLEHSLVATTTTSSHPDGAVQDDETATATLVFRNGASPLSGLPLP